MTGPSQREIAEYNDRPNLGSWCFSNGDGTCEDGQESLIINRDMICTEGVKEIEAMEYIEMLEAFRWRCLKFKRCER